MSAHIDFETRSLIDLGDHGLDVYAADPSTEPLCLGFALEENDPIDLWVLGMPLSPKLSDHVHRGGLVFAHNAQFELEIWNRVCRPRWDWPELKIEQVRCTMAMGYAMGLPGKLEEMAPALGIDERKDLEGHRVMLQLCKPRKIYKPGERIPNRKAPHAYQRLPDGRIAEWWNDPAKFQKLYTYCQQDVNVERAMTRRLVPLSAKEQALWVLDQRINRRGVHIDKAAVQGALVVVAAEKKRLDAEMERVTGGMVQACTNTNVLTDFLRFMGVETGGVAKADVVELLERPDLPPSARTALLLRQEAAKASLAKLDKMAALLGPLDRIRFILAYHAATTGRWGGRGIQPQNFARPPKWLKDWREQDKILNRLREPGDHTAWLDMMYGPPMDVLVACIRGFINAAPGHVLIADDFSNIEGRVIAWLAGEEWKLDAFRAADAGTGPGIYQLAYSRSFGVPVEEVDDFMRQIGKVLELACGFGGGVGAFQAMAKVYGVKVKDKDAEIFKNSWREVHPAIKKFWYDLEGAAIQAVLNPRQKFTAGHPDRPCTYMTNGSFLWCLLPSKRALCYPYPKIMRLPTPWGEEKDMLTFMTQPGERPQDKARIIPDPANRNKWARVSTYGGSLAENVTQAVARDLLAEAIVRIESKFAGDGIEFFDIGKYVSDVTALPDRAPDWVRTLSPEEYVAYMAWKRQKAENEGLKLAADQGLGVVMHAHDEVVFECPDNAPPGMLAWFEGEMGRLPAWAVGLPVESKGWRGYRYRKD